MEKKYFSQKGLWVEVFKFLDINDYFSAELANKSLRNELLAFYKIKTLNIQTGTNMTEKNLKKLFLSKYMNSFVVFNVQQEFNGLEQMERNPELFTNTDNNLNSTITNLKNENTNTSAKKEKDFEVSTLIENTQTCCNSVENSLFNQE